MWTLKSPWKMVAIFCLDPDYGASRFSFRASNFHPQIKSFTKSDKQRVALGEQNVRDEIQYFF